MNDRCGPVRFAALVAGLIFALPAWADTELHLAETATVMAGPDEIAATLRVETTSPSPAEAQARANAMMQQALTQAHKVAGLVVSTGGYVVWRVGPDQANHNERWQVSQTLSLTGHEAPPMLTLTGSLQQQGLVVSSLGWRLSPAGERQAHQQATKQALVALRGRVDEAAVLLDLRFEHFKDIRLDSVAPQPLFRAMAPAMAMGAAAAAPPSVAAEDVPVSATAEADAILVPR
jgi:predicted secreted protein